MYASCILSLEVWSQAEVICFTNLLCFLNPVGSKEIFPETVVVILGEDFVAPDEKLS